MWQQVAALQQQLKDVKPYSRPGPAGTRPRLHPRATGGTKAAADELGHLHTQVEGVESTIASLRSASHMAAAI